MDLWFMVYQVLVSEDSGVGGVAGAADIHVCKGSRCVYFTHTGIFSCNIGCCVGGTFDGIIYVHVKLCNQLLPK